MSEVFGCKYHLFSKKFKEVGESYRTDFLPFHPSLHNRDSLPIRISLIQGRYSFIAPRQLLLMLVDPLLSNFRHAFVAALLDNTKQRLLLSRASAKCQVRHKLASTTALAWPRGVAVDPRGSVIVVLYCFVSQIATHPIFIYTYHRWTVGAASAARTLT